MRCVLSVLLAALLPSAAAFTTPGGVRVGVVAAPRSKGPVRMGMFDGFSKAFENDQSLGQRKVRDHDRTALSLFNPQSWAASWAA